MVAGRGMFYRWRGAMTMAAGFAVYVLLLLLINPWLHERPGHLWSFEGGVLLLMLALFVFRWRRRARVQ